MNKILKTVLTVLLASTLVGSVFAQGAGTGKNTGTGKTNLKQGKNVEGPRRGGMMATFAEKLKLTKDQQAKLAKLQESQQVTMKKLQLSKEAPELKQKKIKEARAKYRKDFEAILTAKQKAELKKMMEERQAKRKANTDKKGKDTTAGKKK